MNTIKIYTLLLCGFLSLGLNAQQYVTNIRHFSVKDGLSNRFARVLMEDDNGFIWIGTLNGLNRFDGYEFKVYNHKNAGLQNEGIFKLFEDPDGMIWATYLHVGKMDVFNPRTQQAVSVQEYFTQPLPFTFEELEYIVPNQKDNHLYFYCRDGRVYRYEGQQQFTYQYQFHDLEGEFFACVLKTEDQGTWIQNRNQLVLLDAKNTILQEKTIPTLYYLIGEDNNTLYFKPNIGSKAFQQFFCLYPEQDSLTPCQPSASSLSRTNVSYHHFAVDAEHHILYEIAEKGITHILYSDHEAVQRLNPMIFPDIPNAENWAGMVNTLLIDQNNIAWIGTESGIFILEHSQNKFSCYLDNSEGSLYSARGMHLLDSTHLIVVGWDSSYVIDLVRKEKQLIPGLPGWLRQVIKTSNGEYWFSADYGDNYLYSFSDQKARKYNYREACIQANIPNRNTDIQWALLETKEQQNILIGAFSGLFVADGKSSCLSPYSKYNDFQELGDNTVFDLSQQGRYIWIASTSGLYQLDEQKGVIARYHKAGKGKFQLPCNTLLYIHETAEGLLWLGSRGYGCFLLDPEQGILKHYTSNEGLSDDVIYAVYPDKHGYLWMSSNNGLMRMHLKSEQITTYLEQDGIANNEFNRVAFHAAPDGRLFFGGITGITSFHPDSFQVTVPASQYPFYITQYLQLNGRTGELVEKTNELLQDLTITLPPQDKSFLLKFALLDYANAEHVKYYYRIRPLGENWTAIEENFLRIQGLAPGSYQLELKAQSINAQSTAQQLSIPIQVLAPVYLRWWFILSILLLVIIISMIAYLWRIRRLKAIQLQLEQKIQERTQKIQQDKTVIEQQAQQLRQINNLKTNFFTNISHELRTPLTLIMGPVKLLLQKKEEDYEPEEVKNTLKKTYQNSQQLKTLLDELMDLSKLESQKLALEEKPVFIAQQLQQLFSAFELEARNRQIQFNYKFDAAADLCILMDVSKLKKIVNNLLSNAFKYTADHGSISMQIKANEQQIFIRIEDDGQGIPAADLPYIFDRFYQSEPSALQPQSGTGVGLALSKELAELMGGNIEVTSEHGKGSQFLVKLPFQKVSFQQASEQAESDSLILPAIPRIEGNRPSLLLVEDHPEMRQFLQDLLVPHFQLQLARDGQEAVEILEKPNSKFQLILSDIMMPRMDGYALLKWLKSHTHWQHTPVIMLTAKTQTDDRLKALRIGVDDYIHKPFNPEELLVRIINLLKHQLDRQQFLAEVFSESQQTESLSDEETLNEENKWLAELEEQALLGLRESPQLFGTPQLAAAMHLSERQFRRRVKTACGLTPVEYLKEVRLQWARELIESGEYSTVKEVSLSIGMNAPSYFSKLYLQRFGKRPADLLEA